MRICVKILLITIISYWGWAANDCQVISTFNAQTSAIDVHTFNGKRYLLSNFANLDSRGSGFYIVVFDLDNKEIQRHQISSFKLLEAKSAKILHDKNEYWVSAVEYENLDRQLKIYCIDLDNMSVKSGWTYDFEGLNILPSNFHFTEDRVLLGGSLTNRKESGSDWDQTILEIDYDGNLINAHQFDFGNTELGHDFFAGDEHYFIIGDGLDTNYRLVAQVRVSKISKDFKLVDSKTYGVSGITSGCQSGYLASNGDILIVGETASDTSNSFDYLFYRIDQNLNLINSVIYPGKGSDALFTITELPDGNLAMAGYTGSNTDSTIDVGLLFTSPDGTLLEKQYLNFGKRNDSYGIEYFDGYVNICGAFFNQNFLLDAFLCSVPYTFSSVTMTNQLIELNGNILQLGQSESAINVSIYDYSGLQITNFDTQESILNMKSKVYKSGVYFIKINIQNEVKYFKWINN